jgi:hypothetical protein
MMDELRDRYRRFADVECADYGPLYFKLSHAVAEDNEILSFILESPDRQPNLFLASIHYLAGSANMPRNADELSQFVKVHREALGKVMRSHHTQTNEVGRCAALLPALGPSPVALIEVGASAGLCLMLDRYRYDYGSVLIGSSASPVLIRCELDGQAPLPGNVPSIVWRFGLDIDPIDLQNSENVRWLLACVWPDHPERRQRLQAAISLCRNDPPPMMRGDLVDDLPALIRASSIGL